MLKTVGHVLLLLLLKKMIRRRWKMRVRRVLKRM
mgnify:CR=1 FL=1